VKNPFTGSAYFDFEEFFETIDIAVRTMDDIIELEIEKIRQIIKKITLDKESYETKLTELSLWNRILESAILGRRAGISIIGHADVAAMLGFDYLSEKSLSLYEKLHKELLNRAYSKSSDLAVQRGSFPEFNFDKEVETLNKTALDKSVIEKIRVQGRRNIALLTIPPSGSLSIIRGISSGIEPVFMVSYKRRRKVNPNDKNVTVTFVDEVGDAWEEYTVVHPGFSKYMLINYGISEETIGRMSDEKLDGYIRNSPYYQQTAEFIDPIQKVRMQGMIQKYIDHSISVTTNLVSTATEQDVHDIYKEAWETGCKGVTVYRDGVRSGVLVKSTESTTSNAFSYREAHKRPRAVECDVIRAMYKGKKYIVLVGLQNGIPYETFLFSAENVSVPLSMNTGLIVKKRKKVYNLANEDGTVVVDDILNEMRYPEHGYVTKLISLSLRHGADIKFVVEQLDDEYGNITDISKVLARALRKYIPVPSEVIKTGKPCPECGAELVSEGGCEQCYSCGYGACK
jgi:ribonucleoside-diphosphate reductase alpha chain